MSEIFSAATVIYLDSFVIPWISDVQLDVFEEF